MKTHSKPDLDTEVHDLLAKRVGSWPAVAQNSGVSYSWLSKFFNGHIPNPGVETLKKIRTACRQVSK
jgi:transcriptional regulator with XRE-family HTH domain